VTSAERSPDPADYAGADPELLVPASSVFVPPDDPVSLDDAYAWWRLARSVDRSTPSDTQLLKALCRCLACIP